ncbi:MAG TPA: hypothetical protein VNO23_19060, partial [Candidatus Binatia bacterium]|nr:hypothetical protein [Candidatus Binatia bacterium]
MKEVLPTAAARRRHVVDGGFTLALLVLAVVQGYALLAAPLPLGARPLPSPVARVDSPAPPPSPAPAAE